MAKTDPRLSTVKVSTGNFDVVWLRRTGGRKRHAVLRRNGSGIEFYCGDEGDDADLVLSPTSRKCVHCVRYLKNSLKRLEMVEA